MKPFQSPTSRPTVPVLGLHHHQDHHGRDEQYGGHHEGKDDVGRRVAQCLGGTILEVVGVDFHEERLHGSVRPRKAQALGRRLRTNRELVIGPAGHRGGGGGSSLQSNKT